MQHIVLISCVSQKASSRSKCEDLYLSPLFKKSLRYARSLAPDRIFVLSAKYHLVPLDKELDPYNETLNKMKVDEVRKWADKVRGQLQIVADLTTDKFTFLAGLRYRQFLIPHIRNYSVPMIDLPIGRQLQYLNERIS